MELLSAVALTCCLMTGTPDVPTGVAENLQMNSVYIEFPQELKPYLTEEQEAFLDNTYTLIDDETQQQIDSIIQECEQKKAEEEARIAEQKRLEEEAARLAKEQAYYQQISDNISSAISRTPSPGLHWCAKWVSIVYQNAGYAYISGDACDMYWKYCSSANKEDLKNGMLIAVPSWNGGYMSYTYGHVGIYMDGTVWHNIGNIVQTPLDEWIATYGQIAETRWGFAF